MSNDKLKRSSKYHGIYKIYTILFCIISFMVFFVFIKNNKGLIWDGDGLKQHYAILYDFNQIIRNIFSNGFSMISWNMGLGLDVIGQYSYYIIGDPFAYISLLFPMKYLETIYSVLVIVRIYCVGLAFIAYCKHQNRDKISTILGSIIYAFSGFVLYAGIRHPYFTNAVILLPLNFIGIEKFLRDNKKTFFTLIIFISAISNYYFFYMITIIDVIYAVIKYIFEYNKGIKDFFITFFKAGLYYIIGLAMASVIFLPTIYAFLNSSRTGCEPVYQYISNFYQNFWLGITCMRFKNWSVVSVASIVIPMLAVLFTKLKEKESRSYFTLFIITTTMLMFPFVASMMNGFSFPSNRWIFAYAFILSYIVTICFDKKLQYSKKQIILMSIVTIIYLLVGIWITKFKIKSNLDFYINTLIAICILIIIILNYREDKVYKVIRKILDYWYIVTIGLVIINISITAFALYSSKGKGYATEYLNNNSVDRIYSSLNGKIKYFKEAVEYIKENDTGLYRIAKCDTSNENMSLIYDYNPIQIYLSIGNGCVYELSEELEDNCFTSTRCINGMDRRTKIMTLLGTKYFVCDENYTNYVPYGYSMYKELDSTKIYINDNYLSVGIFYNNYILKEEFDDLSPIQKEDVLLNSAVLDDEIEQVEKNNNIQENLVDIRKLDFVIERNSIIDNRIEITKDNQSINLEIEDIRPNEEIYLSIKNLKDDSIKDNTDFKITTTFNKVKGCEQVKNIISSAYYMENQDFLINLGVTNEESNNKLKIKFNNKGIYTFDNMEILSISMKDYENKVEILKNSEMINVEVGNNFISGNINTNTNGILQISTSYSDGWKAFVDGKETEVVKVNDGFIGVILEKGEHEIIFKYETPYLKLGAIVSLIATIIFIVISNLERRNKI